jgi:hypothetical protein
MHQEVFDWYNPPPSCSHARCTRLCLPGAGGCGPRSAGGGAPSLGLSVLTSDPLIELVYRAGLVSIKDLRALAACTGSAAVQEAAEARALSAVAAAAAALRATRGAWQLCAARVRGLALDAEQRLLQLGVPMNAGGAQGCGGGGGGGGGGGEFPRALFGTAALSVVSEQHHPHTTSPFYSSMISCAAPEAASPAIRKPNAAAARISCLPLPHSVHPELSSPLREGEASHHELYAGLGTFPAVLRAASHPAAWAPPPGGLWDALASSASLRWGPQWAAWPSLLVQVGGMGTAACCLLWTAW